ncbi:vanillate O-demethylase oxygenase subunit [Pseudomonas aeruginosa]|nr:vanillate O-demethylase oxygenase subunit [Pseudomonas aeruginosa]
MVFYRGEEGRVVALEDFCPHRGAPLSLGFVEDGVLVCGYHGLAMGEDGRTRSMPGQRVRGFPCIRHFPVVERHGFVWVWPGDAGHADATLIPRLEWAESPDWAYGGGLYHIHCDYRLMIDNLMDLTHETYVHASSIGQKEIDEAAPSTRVEGDEVDHLPPHGERHGPAVLAHGPARQRPGRRRAGGPLADLPLHATQPPC